MAKKKLTRSQIEELKANADYDQHINEVNIGKECREYMQIFGANNNIQRHMPDIVDGLKIGERRLLYSMWTNGAKHDARHMMKVASIMGDTLKYHPHGEISVYGTIVRLAQPWNMSYPLIQGSGNFGNSSGDGAAAARYIDAKLSYYAYKCFFEDFDPNIVDMVENYTRDKMMPEYLPAKYPNILISNTFGIGYGVATSIPPFNLKEVLELTIKLMDNPKHKDCTLIPDPPSGCIVIDTGDFKEMCETGFGRLRCRGHIDIEPEENCLVFTSTPPQTKWIDIKPKILALLADSTGKNSMLVKISNDAIDSEMCYRLYLKKEVNPIKIRELIYKKTSMEDTMSVQFRAVEDFTDMTYNIRTMLNTWINFRRETKRRQLNHELLSLTERKHILEILLFLFAKDNAEKTLKIMKNSANKLDIVDKLMKTYSGRMSSLQASEIAELKGYQYSKEYQEKYARELETIDKRLEEIRSIIIDPKKIDKLIKAELKEGIELFGRPRRCPIVKLTDTNIIPDTKHKLILTAENYVKKLPHDTDSVGFINPGDIPVEVMSVRNREELLVFDINGKVGKLPISDIQDTLMDSGGEPIQRYAPDITGKVISIKAKPDPETIEKEFGGKVWLLMLTKNGLIKKTSYASYHNIRSGTTGILLKEGDELIDNKILLDEKDIIIYTNKGRGVRFNSVEIRSTSRLSAGVSGITGMVEDEFVIGMDIVNKSDKYIFVMSDTGVGKLCDLSTFETLPRNTKPLNILLLEGKQNIAFIHTVKGKEIFRIYCKNDVGDINMKDVPVLPRTAKGKKIFTAGRGNTIISIKGVK